MTSEKSHNTSYLFIVLIAVAAFAALAFGCRGEQHEQRKPKEAPNVIIKNGVTVLTLEGPTREREGIIVAPLKAVFHQKELRVYGTVLRPDDLVDLRSSYLAAKASADKTTAALDASLKEYERLKKLNENKNVSDKALQAAGAALASNKADAAASSGKVQAVKHLAMARWGRVVSEWIFSSSPELKWLLEFKDCLIRATLPSDQVVETAPESIGIQTAETKVFSARLVETAPDADPLTRGMSFFYLSSSHSSELMPGMNVRTFMPVGPIVKGVVVPFSSVVWFQGKAWAYVWTDHDHFMRREVPISNPVRDGYFASGAFKPEEKVVIEGAQILLSQESQSPMPGGGEEEED